MIIAYFISNPQFNIWNISTLHGLIRTHKWSAPNVSSFIAQFVRASHRYRGHRFKLRWSPDFFRLLYAIAYIVFIIAMIIAYLIHVLVCLSCLKKLVFRDYLMIKWLLIHRWSENFPSEKTLVQSLNSPFFPPHMGAEPGRAKRESRITCMRVLRIPPFFPPKSGEKPYLEARFRFGL